MDYNISELLDEIKNKRLEQTKVVLDMSRLRREYNASLNLLQDKYVDVSNKISEIGNLEFPVKLGDLVEEICWLSKTNYDEICISMCGNNTLDGVHNMDDFLKFFGNRAKCNIQFRLSNRDEKTKDETSMFNYSNSLLFDLNSIQADGKTLLEHCSVVIKTRLSGAKYTEFVIDRDIENVILPLTINYVSLESSANWIPSDLFTQAVINSVEKYRENAKVLKRVKEEE